MAKQGENNIKLGLFVLAGLLVLMVAFYMIGKNRNIFGSDFELKARFSSLNGLMEGNNVLFSGIQAGTVKSIEMVNDTTIEVTLQIDSKVKSFIHKNALAAIGTEGLMGNKVVNIQPVKAASFSVSNGDMLTAQKLISTEEMLQTLSKTNNNIASISEALKATVLRLDSSAIFDILNDKTIGPSLKSSLGNINKASKNASDMTMGLNELVTQIKQGKGAAGLLLTDTAFAGNLKQAITKLKSASDNANKLTLQANMIMTSVNHDMNDGHGTLHALLKDSLIARKISISLDNVMKGTDGFNQNMEALKHNFFFKGYFKDLEKKKQANKALPVQ
ncbi:MlaD family protein [Mucilaginibacter sp. FT3.2]|uniref:MlaD family protein n=1 Tax=Mucilaginibacter sp. FT3.2 TaxID=2723090 RepID=UPI001608A175|nr:MlaD family protein [Mucilaginibacter sp. FT3.2]MBB6233706.1 phospholipid/cholesterol/gamma-HCH transport system substrate-binding protein [Mucilaginibacter sp. FT3.2]